MNNDNDMIEILDDVNEDSNTLNNPSTINNNVQSQQGVYQEQPVNQTSVNMVQNQPNEGGNYESTTNNNRINRDCISVYRS